MSILLILVILETPPYVVWTSLFHHNTVDTECMDDINSDGSNDVAVASLLNQSTGLYCLSGADGSLLWSNQDLPGVLYTGALTVFPDVNNDGVSDLSLATGWGTSPWNNMIITVSGADGSIIWTFSPGFPVQSINHTEGPPGTYPVLHAAVIDNSGYTRFLALDSFDGDSLWCLYAWTDDNTVVTANDMNGNDWEEIGVSQDRGSAYSGYCEVRDGLTGEQIYFTSPIYYCRMDITDTPCNMIATGHWGIQPHLFVENITTSDTLYQIQEEPPWSYRLHFTRNVSGGSLEFPILLGWLGNSMYIYSGLEGSYQNPYLFSGSIASVNEYQITPELWRLAILTTTYFYTTEPDIVNPSSGEACILPGGNGVDFSLFSSDLYPTPVAAVAMNSGVAAIATSWPVEAEEETSAEIHTEPLVSLEYLPGRNGLTFNCNAPGETTILDITGRQVHRFASVPGGQFFVDLLPGMYLITETASGALIMKAVVVGE